ncbi:hypothetical protein R1X32_02025 (plasmid) [Rhodococcus opacus]|nr:hypothetical protein HJ581_0047230 [Rhodococcus opacus]
MKRELVGRKVIVTGAARGIGEQVARLAAPNWQLISTLHSTAREW